ncbi:MAG: RCC1 domain-containing protein [Polyangiaceae bacterium]
MRSRTKLLFLVGLATSSLALVHCVGDEPASPGDDAGGGGDSGTTPDTFVPPGDSGQPIPDAGPDSGVLCPAGVNPCILQIAGGGQTFCARDSDGKIWCWGDNRDEQLGRFDAGPFSAVPMQVALSKLALGISVGGPLNLGTLGASVACSPLLNAGSVNTLACWGGNANGQLGRPDAAASDWNPQEVPALGNIARVSVGPTHVCVTTNTNGLYCWGEGDHGELGRDASAVEPTPMPVSIGGSDLAGAPAVGSMHTCVLDVSQPVGAAPNISYLVKCFGDNGFLQLGRDPSVAQSPVPLAFSGYHAKGIDTSGNATCSIDGTNGVTCWGSNQFGQIGNGEVDAAGVEQPYKITTLPLFPIIYVAAGFHHTCAIVNQPTNNVYCWGEDVHGQAGVPLDSGALTGNFALSATQVVGLPAEKAVALAAASQATCALMESGTVWCWGENYQGELGDRDDGGNDSLPLPPAQIHF